MSAFSAIRIAARNLAARPGVLVAAVASLALGIGANTAVFSVLDAVVLRPLPYTHPEQLLLLRDHQPCCGEVSLSPVEFYQYRQSIPALSGLAGYVNVDLNLTGRREAARLSGTVVTPDFFEVLGAHALKGRLLSSDLDRSGQPFRSAVLAEAVWRSRFGADPNVIGSTILLNKSSFRVVGILPAALAFPSGAEVWVTPRLDTPEYSEAGAPDPKHSIGDHWLGGLGRLKPGYQVEQAQAEFRAAGKQMALAHVTMTGHYGAVHPMHQQLIANLQTGLRILSAAVALVLLIACVNVAGLLVARNAARSRELAIRFSLGASRWNILTLMLAETMLLTVAGALAGIAFAGISIAVMQGFLPFDLPASMTPGLNLPVLEFTALVALATAGLCAVIPALTAAELDVHTGLKHAAKSVSASSTRRLRNVLVGAEIAVSLTLLVGAGLLIRSFAHLLSVDPGFRTAQVLTARVFLPPQAYTTTTQVETFWEAVRGRLAALPTTEGVSFIDNIPFGGSSSNSEVEAEGVPPAPPGREIYANQFTVDGGLFSALGIPLLQGRDFDDRDTATSQPVVVVNQALADYFFPHQSALGKRIGAGGNRSRWPVIVGVVGNVRHEELAGKAELDRYFCYRQVSHANRMTVVVRTTADPALFGSQLRAAVQAAAPDVPVFRVTPMDEYVLQSLSGRRFHMGLLAAFAGLALLISAVGIYGAASYASQQRTREVGLRMALGARRGQILSLMLRDGLTAAGVGTLAGMAGAAGASRLMRFMIEGVPSWDVATYLAAASLMLAVALLACAMPALRAASTDPAIALRED